MKTLNSLIILIILQVTLFAQNSKSIELWQKKDWNSLIQNSDAQIQSNPADYQAYYWKQYALLQQGKRREVTKVLLAALKACENKMEIRSELANHYFQQGMYLKAKSLLDTLISQPKPEYRNLEQRVLIHEFEKEPQAAIELLRKGWGYDATKAFYWIHLGDNHKIIGDYESAIQDYESALALNSSDYQTSSKLARLYLMDSPKTALEICQYVLEKDSTNVRFIQIAASAHLKMEEEAAALSQYEKAMTLGDSTLNTIRNAGILYSKDLTLDKSIDLLNKAYAIDSTDVKVVFYLGMAKSRGQDPIRGMALFDESLLLLQPDSSILSIIYKEKAMIFEAMNKHMSALDSYQRAYKLNPQKKFYLYLIANQYDALNKKQQAINYYQQFVDGINPDEGMDLQQAAARDFSQAKISKLKEDLFME